MRVDIAKGNRLHFKRSIAERTYHIKDSTTAALLDRSNAFKAITRVLAKLCNKTLFMIKSCFDGKGTNVNSYL